MYTYGMGAMPNPALVPQRSMARFDSDRSGGLNLQEFTSMRETALDRRPDTVYGAGSAENLFNRMDADSSGELSSREIRNFNNQGISTNPPFEGTLSPEVMSTYRNARRRNTAGKVRGKYGAGFR